MKGEKQWLVLSILVVLQSAQPFDLQINRTYSEFLTIRPPNLSENQEDKMSTLKPATTRIFEPAPQSGKYSNLPRNPISQPYYQSSNPTAQILTLRQEFAFPVSPITPQIMNPPQSFRNPTKPSSPIFSPLFSPPSYSYRSTQNFRGSSPLSQLCPVPLIPQYNPARVNQNIPLSNELEGTSNQQPFYGIVTNPDTFRDWEGLSEAVFRQQNLARTNPKLYAQYVEQEMRQFVDNEKVLIDNSLYTTKQGPAVWQQTINFLNRQQPVPPLRRVKCLDCSAKFMAQDSSKNSIFGHKDSYQMQVPDRLRIACLRSQGGQNIAYGYRSARSIILALLVDDNVADRGHRLNLYRNYTQGGVGSGKHNETYKIISVQDFLY